MEKDQLSDMYGEDDEIYSGKEVAREDFRIRKNGILTEVHVAGEKLTVVDPSVVRMLEKTVSDLRTRIQVLEQDLRTLSSNFRRSESMLREVRSELDRKVSYE